MNFMAEVKLPCKLNRKRLALDCQLVLFELVKGVLSYKSRVRKKHALLAFQCPYSFHLTG